MFTKGVQLIDEVSSQRAQTPNNATYHLQKSQPGPGALLVSHLTIEQNREADKIGQAVDTRKRLKGVKT